MNIAGLLIGFFLGLIVGIVIGQFLMWRLIRMFIEAGYVYDRKERKFRNAD